MVVFIFYVYRFSFFVFFFFFFNDTATTEIYTLSLLDALPIGILSAFTPTSEMVGPQPRSPFVNALLRRLRELGYVYGEHFVTEPRGGEGRPERYQSLAVELVRLQVDVIVAPGPMLRALKQATTTI